MKGEKVSDTQKAAASRQIWAASMMTRNVEVFESIMNGDKVLVRQLEQVALRRALRGAALPPDDSYIEVSMRMLFAVNEGGAFDVADDGTLREPQR